MSNWRPIKDFPNYDVSDQGEVRNVLTNCVLKGQPNNGGYLRVKLCTSGRKLRKFVHRLIAETFIPNPSDLPVVDHINHARDDNRVMNLRWTTPQQNSFNRSNTKGYCFVKHRNKFMASIKVEGKYKNLGYYDTEVEARAAYLAAKKTMHIIDNKPKIVVNVTLKAQV